MNNLIQLINELITQPPTYYGKKDVIRPEETEPVHEKTYNVDNFTITAQLRFTHLTGSYSLNIEREYTRQDGFITETGLTYIQDDTLTGKPNESHKFIMRQPSFNELETKPVTEPQQTYEEILHQIT